MRINHFTKGVLLSLKYYPTNTGSLAKLFQDLYDTDYLQRLDGINAIKSHPVYSNYYELFFKTLLPWMMVRIKQFLKTRKYRTIDRLKQNEQKEIEIPKEDVVDLIIAMFFGLYSNPQSSHNVDFYDWVLSSSPICCEKLLCLFEYFRQNMLHIDNSEPLRIKRAVLTTPFTKETLLSSLSKDTWKYSTMIVNDRGFIGDVQNDIQVDFANKYIGGGVLTTGCVQEEIMFCMNPELLEAIVISNVKTFNTSTGYAHSFHFHGPFQSPSPSPLHTILAIDALNYRHNFLEQFNEDKVLREFNKLVCGFSSVPPATSIASGNWGCGAFRGFKPLKILLQWIVASMYDHEIHIYTFNDPSLASSLTDFQSFIANNHIPLGKVVKVHIFYNLALFQL